MDKMEIIDDTVSGLTIKLKRSYISKHGADWNEQRVKADYTLWNIMQGSIYIELNGITYTVSAGDVVVFHPGTHYTAYTDSDGCKFMYNRFEAQMGRSGMFASLLPHGVIPCEAIGKACNDFCNEFSQILNSPVSFKRYALFITYLSKIIECSDYCASFYINPVSITPADPDIIKAAEYIDASFSQGLTVTELAKKAAMSEKYFIARFKKIIGLSPWQYIIRCRMQAAAQLILNTDKTIAEISKEVGYANPYTFSNTFKKYYEESPANFKKHFVS